MEKLIPSRRYLSDPIARTLLEALNARQEELLISDAVFYYDFPSFRDYEDDTCRPNALILSPRHGIIALNFADSEAVRTRGGNALVAADETLTQFFSILFGRLIKSRILRRARNELAFPFNSLIYSPGLDDALRTSTQPRIENPICNSFEGLTQSLTASCVPALDQEVIREARSIVEGAKAMTVTPQS